MMKSFPFFRQLDEMDCGPTCLQMVAMYHGKYYTLMELRQRSYLTREGVSMLDLSNAAESIGLRNLGVRVSFSSLEHEAILPAIVHWRRKHFVVVYGIRKNKVRIVDPGAGHVTLSKEEFLSGWISTKENGQDLGVALLLEPTPRFYEYDPEMTKYKRKSLFYLFNYLKVHKRSIYQLLVGLFAGSLIQLAFPFLTQAVVDVGIGTQNIQFIYLVLAAQMMLFISRTSVDFIRRWIMLNLSTRVNIQIVSDFLAKLFKLPMSFFEGKLIGDILRRIEDHSRIERFLTTSSLNIVFTIFTFAIFSTVLAFYHVSIFLVFLGMSLLYVIYVLLFMKLRAELDYKRFLQMANNQSSLIESIHGMREIKMNNCEIQRRWEWERIQVKLYHINIRSTQLQQWQDAGGLFLNETKNIIITIMAALAVINGQITLGMMMAMQYIIAQLNGPLSEFIGFSRDLQDAKISLERIGEIHSADNEEELDELHKTDMLPIDKTIVIEQLSFQYGGPNSIKILDKIDLEIPEGKITAIVGASGSGKTTLMKLLLKFYNPTEGSIELGGCRLSSQDGVTEISSRVWRRSCGTVMQDGYIFSDTIARNIALSDESIDKTRLMRSADIGNIGDFIDSLPLGYNTKVGSNGVGLSQGQRQRILIARAAYKDPEFIFFDEATSSLDANNESIIMRNLDKFFRGKTVVIIAHRLSTIKHADQIIVLEKGKIVEIGHHESLSRNGGMYYELVRNQMDLGNTLSN